MNLQRDPAKVRPRLDAAGVPEGIREQAIQQVLGILQENMVRRLEAGLTDEQLEEFQKYADSADLAPAIVWLTAHFPNYEQIVDEELTAIVNDLQKTVVDAKAS